MHFSPAVLHSLRAHLALCAATALACLPAAAQSQLVFTEYQFNAPKLETMALDGSNVSDLFLPSNPFPTSDWLPLGLAIDAGAGAGKVYWSHGSFNDGRIRRANLDGSGQELLVGSLKLVRGLALDLAAGKMYWANSPAAGNAGGIIERANLDGTGRELVYAITPYHPTNSKIGRPTVDFANGWVWFGANDKIVRVNLEGPPFVARTVVTGLSTPTRVELDAEGGWVYGIDSDTISDCVWRARLDGTGFEVVLDTTPDVIMSSGLLDLAVDRVAGTLFFADEIGQSAIARANLDGSGLQVIFTSQPGWSPAAITFNASPSPGVEDCNHNGVRDLDDFAGGTSADCNANGVPDECEGGNPCAPEPVLLNQPDALDTTARALGGSSGWQVFQPFDVPAGGWAAGVVRLDGYTTNYASAGFTATLFPDNGANHPDETQPIASDSAVFRFSRSPVEVTFDALLPSGKHWIRLTANSTYSGGVHIASTGLPSFSRSSSGNEVTGPPITLKLLEARPFETFCSGDGSAAPCPCANLGATGHGCANSFPTFGAQLSADGLASVAADSVVLNVTGLPPVTSVIFLQGTTQANGGLGIVLGDGLRCVAGSLIRLAVKTASGGTSAYPQGGDLPVSVRGMLPAAGGLRHYQAYYRNPDAFCTPDTFNWTNGLAAEWLP